jgi:hypothetical protein
MGAGAALSQTQFPHTITPQQRGKGGATLLTNNQMCAWPSKTAVLQLKSKPKLDRNPQTKQKYYR